MLTQAPQGRPALDYVTARGMTPELISRFQLGYAPADRFWLRDFLRKKNYSDDFLAGSGLFTQKNAGAAFFHDRLMFPIRDRNGKTVAFGARLLHGDGPKYLNSGGSDWYKKGETLFAIDLALPAIRKTKTVYLAEGYMDVIALHGAGITNAAAPLGTAFTEDQARLIKRWAERVKLIFDSDEAGQEAACKAIITCRKNGLSCSVVNLEKKDPAEIFLESGAEGLTNSVKYDIMDMEFLVARFKGKMVHSGGEGKARSIAGLFPFLDTLESEVERLSCVRTIADAFSVESEAVLKDYRDKNPGTGRRQQAPSVQETRIRLSDELFLLTTVAVNYQKSPELFVKLKMSLPIGQIEDAATRELYIALEETARSRETGTDQLLAHILDEDLRKFIIEKGSGDEFSRDPATLVEQGIRGILRKRLIKRRSEIVTELRMAKNEGRDTTELLDEKMRVDEIIRQKEA
jgi:DNA primase